MEGIFFQLILVIQFPKRLKYEFTDEFNIRIYRNLKMMRRRAFFLTSICRRSVLLLSPSLSFYPVWFWLLWYRIGKQIRILLFILFPISATATSSGGVTFIMLDLFDILNFP